MGDEKRGAKGERELMKDLVHCTTSAAGRAPTHPSCQRETSEGRLEPVHRPHPLQRKAEIDSLEIWLHRSTKRSLRLPQTQDKGRQSLRAFDVHSARVSRSHTSGELYPRRYNRCDLSVALQ